MNKELYKKVQSPPNAKAIFHPYGVKQQKDGMFVTSNPVRDGMFIEGLEVHASGANRAKE